MQQLAVRLARGEEAAFAELYDASADRLHYYLTARLGSRDAASDVLQTAFLRAVKSRRKFRGCGESGCLLVSDRSQRGGAMGCATASE
jgi:DNA-directed RNA polymerase specialized sigma24 family protein